MPNISQQNQSDGVVTFDWAHPDYAAVFRQRVDRLKWLQDNPDQLPAIRAYYRSHIADFINDWGCTVDPKRADDSRPAMLPFVLYPRQREFIDWMLWLWRTKQSGAAPKSREVGLSWLAIATSCSLCLFHRDLAIGFGSSKLELVDKLGDPKSLFWKAREYMALLPAEFTNGWTRADAPEKLIKFPATGSTMAGEGGDDIGRGGRTSMYFVDEAAFLERPMLAEGSLSENTFCRIDISTAHGIGNPFYEKVTKTYPPARVFRFHWRDDPRKDDAWYADRVANLDPVTVAQEIDIDFSASMEGVVIPSAWVQTAIDAHLKLNIAPTGALTGALDVADEGRDLNAFAAAQGILVDHLSEWSGKGSDVFGTTQRAFGLCDDLELEGFRYDADGLGAGVRGDARVINEQRAADGRAEILVQPFRGSAEVMEPEREDVKGRKNKDYFANRKAQSWFALRRRFEITHRAVTAPSVAAAMGWGPDDIISLSSSLPMLAKLMAELSQPTYTLNTVGKIVIDKAPDGTRSPNLADALMILFGRANRPPMRISDRALEEI
jgi:hypothetical protein